MAAESGARKRTATPTPRRPYDPDSLVDVAVHVFLERGYDGASIDNVAKAAGIGKSSIYHHVANKEELLERGIRRALDSLFGLLEREEAMPGKAIDRLHRVVAGTVGILVRQRAEVALLLRVRGNSDTERWALERRRELDRRAAHMVQDAVDEGALRRDLDPLLTARLLFGMINSLTEWYHPDGDIAEQEIVRAIEVMVFDGLARLTATHPVEPPRRQYRRRQSSG